MTGKSFIMLPKRYDNTSLTLTLNLTRTHTHIAQFIAQFITHHSLTQYHITHVVQAGTWVCSVPMAKDGIQIEFKPVLQYNASVPPSPQHSKFSFSSPNLRKSFLFSSSSALFQNQSQADFGDMRSSSQPKKNSISVDSNSPNPYNKKNSISIIEARSPATHKNDLMRSVLMSPFRPSAFSVEGERDESYAIGANYITFVSTTPPLLRSFH